MPRPPRVRAKRRRKAAKAVKAAKASTPAASLTLPPLPLPESAPEVTTGEPLAEPPDGSADRESAKRFPLFLGKKRHSHRNARIGRTLAYIGVAVAVGLFVFYVINSMETSDRAPRAIISEP